MPAPLSFASSRTEFRFARDDARVVFAVARPDASRTFRGSAFLTAPFLREGRDPDRYNVLALFACPRVAASVVETDADLEVQAFRLKDASSYAHATGVPLVVVCNAWCDVATRDEWFELVYVSRDLHDVGATEDAGRWSDL